ncbi:MAG: sigma-70 family RNA polymerase sigma factor [Actinomycetota bacterium]
MIEERELEQPRHHVDTPDEHLVLAAQAGDDQSLETVFRRYRKLIRANARNYFLIGGDHEDVVQESMIGLFKAVRDFREQHETSFRSFALLCIRNQVYSAIKSATRLKHSLLNTSTSFFTGDATGEEADLLERLSVVGHAHDPAHAVIDAEEALLLSAELDELLSPLERSVLDLLVQGRSYAEIAGELDCGVKSVDNAAQRIRGKLERRLRAG